MFQRTLSSYVAHSLVINKGEGGTHDHYNKAQYHGK